MARKLPETSLPQSARFNALVVIPNALQGLFRRRATAVAAATRADVDRWALGLLRGIRRSRRPGPVWVRVMRDRALLALSREDVRRVLSESPDPFAPDPEAKRRGMSHFQPDALTISRGEEWVSRRRFAESVLDTGRPLHRLADRFHAVAGEETAVLLDEVRESAGELGYDAFHRLFRRMTRRVVLGDSARDDDEVSDLLGALMSEANGLPSEPSPRLEPFLAAIGEYVEAAEDGSLVALFAQAPSDERTKVDRQVTHWLFAMQDTLTANAFRALALIASHPEQRARLQGELRRHGTDTAAAVGELSYLEACLEEAMRLWPTTPLLSRETLRATAWNGAIVPAGTQVLISNLLNHRDPDTHDFADRFAPEEWTEGDASEDWSFNHFSHGPQGCPGAGLALFLGKAVLARLLTERRVRLLEPSLDPDRPLPHMLDFFRARFELEPDRLTA
jgi:cytochrome P450